MSFLHSLFTFYRINNRSVSLSLSCFFLKSLRGMLDVLIRLRRITAPVGFSSTGDGASDYDLFKGGGWCFHLTFPLKSVLMLITPAASLDTLRI